MPTEGELRDLLHGDDAEPGALNTERIIRRAKARRRPKQWLTGFAGGMAAVGAIAFTVPAVIGLGAGGGLSSAGGSAADEAAGDDASILRENEAPESATALSSPAAALNLCGAPLSKLAADPDGLELTVAPVAAPATSGWIETTVTLTNLGTESFTGTAGAAVVTLSGNGIVLWHSNGPTAEFTSTVALAPGESVSYKAGFEPVVCSVEDDASSTGFRSGLPPVTTGPYELSAAIDVTPAEAPTRVVSGPATTIGLH